MSKLICTFALDFETVSYSKEQHYHKSGNPILYI